MSTNKSKLLYLQKVLLEMSDESHPLTVKEMEAALEGYNISMERKSIYRALDSLEEIGMDLVRPEPGGRNYFIGTNVFSLSEIRLIIDSIYCSKFITKEKSEKLIETMLSFCSKYDADILRRGISQASRVKALNEHIYYSVDALLKAIYEGKQLSFKYFDYDVRGNKVFREGLKGDNIYEVSPFETSWDNECYYLSAYYKKNPNQLTIFRVDRMQEVKVLTKKQEGKEIYSNSHPTNNYGKGIFSMFSGTLEEVILVFEPDVKLYNVFFDRFGEDTKLYFREDKQVEARVQVAISDSFFGWVFQFGGKIRVVGPGHVVDRAEGLLKELAKDYIL